MSVSTARVCPACGRRAVKVERVSVTIEGDVEVVVMEGACEACGAKYTLTKRMYLKAEPSWRCKRPELAIA